MGRLESHKELRNCLDEYKRRWMPKASDSSALGDVRAQWLLPLMSSFPRYCGEWLQFSSAEELGESVELWESWWSASGADLCRWLNYDSNEISWMGTWTRLLLRLAQDWATNDQRRQLLPSDPSTTQMLSDAVTRAIDRVGVDKSLIARELHPSKFWTDVLARWSGTEVVSGEKRSVYFPIDLGGEGELVELTLEVVDRQGSGIAYIDPYQVCIRHVTPGFARIFVDAGTAISRRFPHLTLPDVRLRLNPFTGGVSLLDRCKLDDESAGGALAIAMVSLAEGAELGRVAISFSLRDHSDDTPDGGCHPVVFSEQKARGCRNRDIERFIVCPAEDERERLEAEVGTLDLCIPNTLDEAFELSRAGPGHLHGTKHRSGIRRSSTGAEAWQRYLSISPPPGVVPSKLFAGVAGEIRSVLESGADSVVIWGESAVGKSCVAARLFDEDRVETALPLWFVQSNDLDRMIASVEEARRSAGNRRLCLVLDEEHQDCRRDEEFFRLLVSEGYEQVLKQMSCQLVLVLRTSTYESLSFGSRLRPSREFHIVADDAMLDAHHAWGLDRPFTAEERSSISKLAGKGSHSMNTFLIDRVFVPSLREGKGLSRFRHEGAHAIIYQYLIASQPEFRRQVLLHLEMAGRFVDSITLWAISALMRRSGLVFEHAQLEAELAQLEADGLLNQSECLCLGARRWTFCHDILRDSAASYSARYLPSLRSFPEAEAQSIVQDEAAASVDAFREGLALWANLAAKSREGQPCVMSALVEGARHHLESRRRELVTAICDSLRDLRYNTLDRRSQCDRTLYDDALRLCEPIAQSVTPEWLLDICEDKVHMMGFVHALLGLAMRTGAASVHPMWELEEAKIPQLHTIAERLTEGYSLDRLALVKGQLPRIRCAQLLMVGARYQEAADLLMRIVEDGRVSGLDPLGWISRIETAVACYLEAGYIDSALKAYERGIECVGHCPELLALKSIYEANAQTLDNWRGDDPPSWLDIVRSREDDSLRMQQESQSHGVAVIGNYVEVPSCALICGQLRDSGVRSEVIYSTAISSLSHLQNDWDAIIVGGPLAPNIQELVRPELSDESFRPAMHELALSKGAAVTCRGRTRKLVWIGGHTQDDVVAAVRRWIAESGSAGFARP